LFIDILRNFKKNNKTDPLKFMNLLVQALLIHIHKHGYGYGV
jgi:hypothetical protein